MGDYYKILGFNKIVFFNVEYHISGNNNIKKEGQQIYNEIHNNQRFLSDFNYFDHQIFQFVNNSKTFLSPT